MVLRAQNRSQNRLSEEGANDFLTHFMSKTKKVLKNMDIWHRNHRNHRFGHIFDLFLTSKWPKIHQKHDIMHNMYFYVSYLSYMILRLLLYYGLNMVKNTLKDTSKNTSKSTSIFDSVLTPKYDDFDPKMDNLEFDPKSQKPLKSGFADVVFGVF